MQHNQSSWSKYYYPLNEWFAKRFHLVTEKVKEFQDSAN